MCVGVIDGRKAVEVVALLPGMLVRSIADINSV